ncbi:MAG: endonuclease III domain-containing protein [Candidatus ainarchaeum sp.]|nr:endonuclease III domain-containing protein [Candidatus ainarchaeum sp.]MDD3976092.1 endonuclease III domain-containing protein [Candidatus ainarchaeum sp.]
MSSKKIIKIYNFLIMEYGYQGWWPLISVYKKTGNYYHPHDYAFPKKKKQIYEICIGCILAQNTSWNNAFLGILALDSNKLLNSKKIMNINLEKLAEIIKPAGYYNQKSEYILNFTKFYRSTKIKNINRDKLLDIKGIGPETADSMLLYAFNKPFFIVDAYTRRILFNLGIINDLELSYESISNIFNRTYFNLNNKEKISFFQEFHALLVCHAKKYYQKKETQKDDPLLKILLWV